MGQKFLLRIHWHKCKVGSVCGSRFAILIALLENFGNTFHLGGRVLAHGVAQQQHTRRPQHRRSLEGASKKECCMRQAISATKVVAFLPN
eukprot:4945525-Amphidinium_carterae.1